MLIPDQNRAIIALLDEYKKALNELVSLIQNLSPTQLSMVRDTETQDPDCISFQNILTHVITSGYNYSIYIENSLGNEIPKKEKVIYNTAEQYVTQLKLMFDYCENLFNSHAGIEIEQTNPINKIQVSWGQQYDIEQLLEHAIVHILRHRRQIESFLKK